MSKVGTDLMEHGDVIKCQTICECTTEQSDDKCWFHKENNILGTWFCWCLMQYDDEHAKVGTDMLEHRDAIKCQTICEFTAEQSD